VTERLVIGVPARNEATTIADLAAALERGAAGLEEGTSCELVLAYQAGIDDTLGAWQGHSFRLPNRVLHAPDGVVGKGHNVKLLIQHAFEHDSHLLMVDGDLAAYDHSAVAAFAGGPKLARGGLVLPLWCRPHGEGNSTDFLATPVIFATFGAKVRHPLAGQRLMARRMLRSIDLDAIPDDYGIDVWLTWTALRSGLPVDQVRVPFPDHTPGNNSGEIMADVARTLLELASRSQNLTRGDVSFPKGWWRGSTRASPRARNLLDGPWSTPTSADADWTGLLEASHEEVLDFWCEQLARAIRRVRAGVPPDPIVRDLAHPFVVHAEYRRRRSVDLEESEEYVSTLCRRLAAALS
jgi:hypothetical protein